MKAEKLMFLWSMSPSSRLGIVDHDVVELNNLHRQIIHSEVYIGQSKVESAAAACRSYVTLSELPVYFEIPDHEFQCLCTYFERMILHWPVTNYLFELSTMMLAPFG